MNNPWFRLYTEFRHDPKVQTMSEAMQRRFVILMCLESEGCLQKLTDDEIAFALNISKNKLQKTKEVLYSRGLITIENGAIVIQLPISEQSYRPPLSEWRRIREYVFDRDNYTCQYCGARGVKLECDHIIPVSRGGDSNKNNLTTACFKCNRSKRDKTPEEWAISFPGDSNAEQ